MRWEIHASSLAQLGRRGIAPRVPADARCRALRMTITRGGLPADCGRASARRPQPFRTSTCMGAAPGPAPAGGRASAADDRQHQPARCSGRRRRCLSGRRHLGGWAPKDLTAPLTWLTSCVRQPINACLERIKAMWARPSSLRCLSGYNSIGSTRARRARFSAFTSSVLRLLAQMSLSFLALATKTSWPHSSSTLLAQGEWVPASTAIGIGCSEAKRRQKASGLLSMVGRSSFHFGRFRARRTFADPKGTAYGGSTFSSSKNSVRAKFAKSSFHALG
jgi:hypothetical protein